MATLESNISKKIMVKISELGGRLFRNNVGLFFTRNGTPVRCGLLKGSSDTIGWLQVKITPAMVGQDIAVFLAIEVKTPSGSLSQEQEHFIEQVNKSGGIAFCARSAGECEQEIIRRGK